MVVRPASGTPEAVSGPCLLYTSSALGKDIHLSSRQKSLLSGEALINDASGVVSFQFAIAAAITGSFSLANAAQSFAISFFGGIAVGLVVGLLAVLALGAIQMCIRDRLMLNEFGILG